jgi:hypothetical protein
MIKRLTWFTVHMKSSCAERRGRHLLQALGKLEDFFMVQKSRYLKNKQDY